MVVCGNRGDVRRQEDRSVGQALNEAGRAGRSSASADQNRERSRQKEAGLILGHWSPQRQGRGDGPTAGAFAAAPTENRDRAARREMVREATLEGLRDFERMAVPRPGKTAAANVAVIAVGAASSPLLDQVTLDSGSVLNTQRGRDVEHLEPIPSELLDAVRHASLRHSRPLTGRQNMLEPALSDAMASAADVAATIRINGQVDAVDRHATSPSGLVSLAGRLGGSGHTLVEMPSSRSSFCAKASEGVFPPASSW